METKKRQVLRYTDEEVELIKSTFADNDDLLRAMRKVFLQMNLDARDLSTLQINFKDRPEILKIVRKTFLPELDPELPLQQNIDLWMTIKIDDKFPDIAWHHLMARKIIIDYFEQQIPELVSAGKIKRKILLKDLTDITDKLPENAYSDMLARNTIISHTEQMLVMLRNLAEQGPETEEQMKKRLAQNSTK